LRQSAWLSRAARHLHHAGIDTDRLDAELILAHVLKVERLTLVTGPDRDLSSSDQARAQAMLQRRAGREPLAHLTGRREFWTLDLAVTPETLIPRPDSETLIEAVLAARPQRDRPWRILDLGTGSGALILALLSEYSNAHGTATDISAGAVAVAAANARALKLAERLVLIAGDWTAALPATARYDILVCNPPYIAQDQIAALMPEVRDFDPIDALAAGDDGLAAYRALAPDLARFAAPGAVLALEIGAWQAAAVGPLFRAQGWQLARCAQDLGGRDRVMLFCSPQDQAATKTVGIADQAR